MKEALQDDTDTSAPIVDCDVLEAAKENIQPIAKGRRVTALSAILSTPHAHRESRLAATRKILRMNVQLALANSTASANDDEPEGEEEANLLEAYCAFVFWVVENYPQGHSAESGLLELLEEATRVLKDHQNGKWRNDIRYLKLWVLYASYVEKPNVIFKFCLVNEIGTEHALLYEEHALALERAGRSVFLPGFLDKRTEPHHRKAEADEAYLLGIARRAAPLERLETKHGEFQKRMMSSPSLSSEVKPSSTADAATPASRTRRGGLGGPSSATTVTRRVTRASSRLNASASSSTPLTDTASLRPQPNARIPIFVDTPIDASSTPHVNNEGEPPSAWPDLGTRKSRVKENVKEATKAAGTTLKQPSRSRRVAVASTPKISVFRDSDLHEEHTVREGKSDMATPPPASNMPGKLSKSRSVKAIAVFCDDSSAGQPEPKKARLSKSVGVFRDEECEAGTSSMPEKPVKSTTSKKSAIPVFRDDRESSINNKPTAKSKGKEPISVFQDAEGLPDTSPQIEQHSEIRSAPTFTPFKDDQVSNASPLVV